MIVKRYTIEFVSDEKTRWLFSERDFMSLLWHMVSNAARSHTEGPEPHILVTPVSDRKPVQGK